MKNTNNNSNTKRGTVMRKCRNIGTMALCLGVFISLCSCLSSGERVDTIKSPEPVTTAAKETSSTEKTTTEAKTTETPTESETEPETEPETEGTYESNKYYEIVEEGSYNTYGTTHLIYKVLAKEDISVDATVIAYADDGSVIGKSSDDITLTAGEGNYFHFMFDSDISNAQLQVQVNFKKDSFMTGERSAVEMVQYNQSGDDLYITFKQVGDEIGSFAEYKLLYYKGDEIVGSERGYFSISAENLNGKDTTDVAEIWAFGEDFDRVEYFYEP